METPTVRRVRARGLQARTAAPVGRVPSRGVSGCEMCAAEAAQTAPAIEIPSGGGCPCQGPLPLN